MRKRNDVLPVYLGTKCGGIILGIGVATYVSFFELNGLSFLFSLVPFLFIADQINQSKNFMDHGDPYRGKEESIHDVNARSRELASVRRLTSQHYRLCTICIGGNESTSRC